ncbi:hypothetical protein [Streptomyces sp. NPDC017529]|uniref:hypothetical protein n=1 Tax=Streptomyces sp. NPDC017529 TaxID=3365000 RepID=UPI003791927F
MNRMVRRAVAVATLSLAAVAGAAGAAQAGASDNHHEANPTIDCRSSYGAAAVLSPTYNVDPQDDTRQCGAVGQAHHPSLTAMLGLANLT